MTQADSVHSTPRTDSPISITPEEAAARLQQQARRRRQALKRLRRLQEKAAAEIERLITFLDACDPYASTELEDAIDDWPIDGDELEPSLCGVTAENNFGFGGTLPFDVYRELEEGNDEPSLGWTDEEAARGQYAGTSSRNFDLEEQCDDEGAARGICPSQMGTAL